MKQSQKNRKTIEGDFSFVAERAAEKVLSSRLGKHLSDFSQSMSNVEIAADTAEMEATVAGYIAIAIRDCPEHHPLVLHVGETAHMAFLEVRVGNRYHGRLYAPAHEELAQEPRA